MTTPQGAYKLKYRIISCTSEDPEFPANELLTPSPQSRGWQSMRFCDYPQEMTLQFMGPVRLRQIQFLSHQAKIASRIDLFTYFHEAADPEPSPEIKYRKLGYLSLDSNDRSGWQARELKSVYMDAPCLYLKFLFQRCHVNKFNLFNQVGVVALSVYGEQLSGMIASPDLERVAFEQLEYETQFDPTTLDRLKVLNAAKERAVKNDDYEEAKRLKEAIDRLKQIGVQLMHLDERKIIAAKNEDYDSARIIKAEIDRLRNAIAPEALLGKYAYVLNQNNPQGMMSPGNQYQQNQGQELLPPVQMASHRPWSGSKEPLAPIGDSKNKQKLLPVGPASFDDMPVGKSNNNNNNNNNQMEEYPREPLLDAQKKKGKKQPNMTPDDVEIPQPKTNGKKKPKNDYELEKLANLKDNEEFDEQVIPSMKGGKKPTNRYNINSDDDPFAEKNSSHVEDDVLTPDIIKKMEPLVPILGEPCCKKLFSKNWSTREEGLKWLEDQVKRPKEVKYKDVTAFWMAVFGAINYTIPDKITQVAVAAISLLNMILSKPAPKINSKMDFQTYVDNIITILIEKLGDANARLRESAETALFSLAKCSAITPSVVVNHLIKLPSPSSKAASKILSSQKHMGGRLLVLLEIVKRFKINNSDVPFESVVSFAVKLLEHSQPEVRNAAIALLVEIYSIVGENKLSPLLAGIRPAQKEILDREFEQISGTTNSRGKNRKNSEVEETIIETNIMHQGAKGKKKGTQQKVLTTKGGDSEIRASGVIKEARNKHNNKDETSKLCEFCGQFDENFLDEGKLDMHFWKECPMLCTCPMCSFVVELSNLNLHLLEECQYKKSQRKCPRCKEAIHVNEYKDHTEEMVCIPSKPLNQANRCPLCHTDIPPGPAGWKKHLVRDGCPNNERTSL